MNREVHVRICGSREVKFLPATRQGDHETVLAIDETDRVFALDHAGVWHLGDTIDAAFVTLITGTRPPRLNAHGEW